MTETVTMTLAEFLLARIAEDEVWTISDHECLCAPPEHPRPDCPARVLAECEAKRLIVELCEPLLDTWELIEVPEDVLRLLALPYVDHPDYCDEWRVG